MRACRDIMFRVVVNVDLELYDVFSANSGRSDGEKEIGDEQGRARGQGRGKGGKERRECEGTAITRK